VHEPSQAPTGASTTSRRDLLRYGAAAGLAIGVGMTLLPGGEAAAAEPADDPLSEGARLAAGVPDVPIVDAHVHLWDSNRLRLTWIDGNKVLDRPWLPADYLAQSAGLRVGGIVYVETGMTLPYKTLEAEWLAARAAESRWIEGAVLWAPLEFGDRSRLFLDDLMTHAPLVKGIRRGIGGADVRLVEDASFIRGVQMLTDYGLSFDILAKGPTETAAAIQLVKKSPGTSFMLDHLLKPDIKGQVLDPWRAQMEELAGFANVHIKLSGMVTEADLENWRPADFAPYVDHVVGLFGEDRIVFGGDWPLVNMGMTYLSWVQTLNALTPQLSPAGKRKLFADNARRFYRLSAAAGSGASLLKGRLSPGQTADYALDYPGDGSVYTIKLQVAPDDASILQYAGFKVYTPSGSLQVVGGAQPSLRPNVAADLISATRGRFTVQVYNANRQAAIDYELSIGRGPAENRRT
jgi:L-fuconolactonase